MINARIFVEKKQGYEVEAKGLLSDLRNNLKLAVDEVRLINIYDVFGIDEADLESAKTNVFSEPMVDTALDNVDMEGYFALAYEALPGQYDQRADSAEQCVRLLNPLSTARIKSGRLALIKGELSEKDKEFLDSLFTNEDIVDEESFKEAAQKAILYLNDKDIVTKKSKYSYKAECTLINPMEEYDANYIFVDINYSKNGTFFLADDEMIVTYIIL